jgi:excisionase family DNA binding protein
VSRRALWSPDVSATAESVSTVSAASSASAGPALREPNGNSVLRVGSELDVKVQMLRLADHLQAAAGIVRELAELPLAAGVKRALMCDVQKPTTPARLLTVRDLAERLAVSDATVRRLRRRGVLPQGIELGGVLRWRPEEIDAWLAAGGCP